MMRVRYVSESELREQGTYCISALAEVEFDETNLGRVKRIVDYIRQESDFELIIASCDGLAECEVYDRDGYKEFMEVWKEAKKATKN